MRKPLDRDSVIVETTVAFIPRSMTRESWCCLMQSGDSRPQSRKTTGLVAEEPQLSLGGISNLLFRVPCRQQSPKYLSWGPTWSLWATGPPRKPEPRTLKPQAHVKFYHPQPSRMIECIASENKRAVQPLIQVDCASGMSALGTGKAGSS